MNNIDQNEDLTIKQSLSKLVLELAQTVRNINQFLSSGLRSWNIDQEVYILNREEELKRLQKSYEQQRLYALQREEDRKNYRY